MNIIHICGVGELAAARHRSPTPPQKPPKNATRCGGVSHAHLPTPLRYALCHVTYVNYKTRVLGGVGERCRVSGEFPH